MIRVLHIINGMGTGGAEKDIMNWYRNIDINHYQFDFLVRSEHDFYKEEILSRGGRYYKVPSFPAHVIENFIETKKFLKTHKEYSIIHVHGNALIYIYPLIIAKKLKIPKRIFHVHSTKANGKLSFVLHNFNKKIIKKFANIRIACSNEAGIFSFGIHKFIVINNAMDLKKYKEKLPEEEYQKLNIDGKYVVGHIGRFLPVKNHRFIVDVFIEIKKKRKDALLLLIGDGELKKDIEDYVYSKGISKSVRFLGERNDVEKIIGLMDIIIFPSLYEGVPLVVLEAQASKTKIIRSDVIDNQVNITPYVKSISINKGAEKWAEIAIDFSNEIITCDIDKCFQEKKFTIDHVVNQLIKIYSR